MDDNITFARAYLDTIQRVQPDVSELNSYASYILLLSSSKTILVWVGRSCSSSDRNLAETVAFDSLRADFDKSGELSQIQEDRANSTTLALQMLLKALNTKYETYKSLENDRLLKKINNNDKILSIITKRDDGTYALKRLITKTKNNSGTVERLSLPQEVDTTRHNVLLSVGNYFDLWLGELVTKKDKDVIKKFIIELAMEKVPVQQRPMESYIFATNLKILDNDSKDTTTIFKYHFVDDKETSKKLTINNRLKKIEVPVNNIPKTSTNVDQCSDCVGEMFFRLLGIASTPMERALSSTEAKNNGSRSLGDINISFNGNDVAMKLEKTITRTSIQYINAPRKKKGLLVLDLDHTLMDFSCRSDFTTEMLKRPYMDYFLTTAYAYYDIAIWSQTNWKWLELKLKELGMLKNNSYKICFALDKSNMFTVKHSYVKPLQLIWRKCSDMWGPHNTLHVDDLSKNFELNKSSGVLVSPFYLKEAHNDMNGDGDAEIKAIENTKQKGDNNLKKLEQAQSVPEIQQSAKEDVELLLLSKYLIKLAQTCSDFSDVDHSAWKTTVTIPPTKVSL